MDAAVSTESSNPARPLILSDSIAVLTLERSGPGPESRVNRPARATEQHVRARRLLELTQQG